MRTVSHWGGGGGGGGEESVLISLPHVISRHL